MSQYIGHTQCYDVLDNILRAYESSGYTRLVSYGQGQSVLMDSKQAPGYVPGVLGKRDGGVEYVPKADGTRYHIYSLAGHKADARQKAEAELAAKSGFDSQELMGTLVSIRRTATGGIQLQLVAGNRQVIENGIPTTKVAIRSVSIVRDPAQGGGVIVALALDQMLGIPYHQLRSLLESEKPTSINAISEDLRARRAGILAESEGTPVPAPVQNNVTTGGN